MATDSSNNASEHIGSDQLKSQKTQEGAQSDQLQRFRLPTSSTKTKEGESTMAPSSLNARGLLGELSQTEQQKVIPPDLQSFYGQSPSSDQRVSDGGPNTTTAPPVDGNLQPIEQAGSRPTEIKGGQAATLQPAGSDGKSVVTSSAGVTDSNIQSNALNSQASPPVGESTSTVLNRPQGDQNSGDTRSPNDGNRSLKRDVSTSQPSPAIQSSSPFNYEVNAGGTAKVTKITNSSVQGTESASTEKVAATPSAPREQQLYSSAQPEFQSGQNATRSVTPEQADAVYKPADNNEKVSADSAPLPRQNSVSFENQNQFKNNTNATSDKQLQGGSTSVDPSNRGLPSRDNSVRTNVSGINPTDSQNGQTLSNAEKLASSANNRQINSGTEARLSGPQSSVDIQGKQSVAGAQNESFGTRRESGVQLPDTKQASGRTDSGVQLPDTKQSTGRTESGGAQMPESRNNTGRNDANNAKLPDAKTLANLDQKFGDKVNPPGKGGGVPIAVPGLPDILGGLRGDKDSKVVKDGKADPSGAKDGIVRNEGPGGKDVKASNGELQGAKGSKLTDDKGDTKSGADDKGAGAKSVRSESENSKAVDGKPGQDGRNATQDGKGSADGRSLDGRSQGGSNLVHDGGTKADGQRVGQSDIGDKRGDRIPSAADKALGDGKTRVDQPGARVVDADGKLIGGRSEQGAATRANFGDKPHIDASAGGKAVGSRGDAAFVLPPGSLPVPDLVGGIKNIGQQIDLRTGKPLQSDDRVGLRQPDKVDGGKFDPNRPDVSNSDATKNSVIKGDINKGDKNAALDGVKSAVIDGVKTVVTGGLRPGDRNPSSGEGKVSDGVKSIVTGGVTGGGVKTAVTGGAKGQSGESVKVVGANDSHVDGKRVGDKIPAGSKIDGALIVPPSVVPLTEMIGNLKGIAARIFPPESRSGRPDVFDNSLPGRKTERLEDRTQSAASAGARPESTIPIIRAIGERIGKNDEQFAIKVPQSVLDANKAPQTKVENAGSVPPWIAPELAVSDKSPSGLKPVDAAVVKSIDGKVGDVRIGDGKAGDGRNSELQPTKREVQSHLAAKAGDQHTPHVDKHDIVHDEAAERLLVNLELVGSIESAAAVESDEEEVFPLAAIEYFGEDFEKAISGEEEVSFDGDGKVAEDDEQSTRYQYIVEAGDTVELIAIKVFKNVTLAPLIFEINKDSIPIGMQDGRMVFTLKVGTVLWLPFPKEVKAYMGRLGGFES